MNLQELKKLVASGESDQIEFKNSTGQRSAAMKTAAALQMRRLSFMAKAAA